MWNFISFRHADALPKEKKKRKKERGKKSDPNFSIHSILRHRFPYPKMNFLHRLYHMLQHCSYLELWHIDFWGWKKILLCVQLLQYGTKLKVNIMTKYSDAFLLAIFGVHINKRHTFAVSSQIIYVIYKPNFLALLQACWPSAKKYLCQLSVLVAALDT